MTSEMNLSEPKSEKLLEEYRRLSRLLNSVQEALRRKDLPRLTGLRELISVSERRLVEFREAPSDLTPTRRKELQELRERLLEQLQAGRVAWESRRKDLERMQAELVAARRFVREAPTSPPTARILDRVG